MKQNLKQASTLSLHLRRLRISHHIIPPHHSWYYMHMPSKQNTYLHNSQLLASLSLSHPASANVLVVHPSIPHILLWFMTVWSTTRLSSPTCHHLCSSRLSEKLKQSRKILCDVRWRVEVLFCFFNQSLLTGHAPWHHFMAMILL